ncbi:MAG: two-component system response regulator CreB [Pseudomonadales bacterium]
MPHILIIEDEAAIADTLVFALRQEGHTTHWTTLAGEGLRYLDTTPADFVILDVGLPDLSGFEALKRLRRRSDVPVLFLTARGEEVDRIVGLELGADDYVVKPFSPREVATRVRGILKRAASPAAFAPPSAPEFAVDRARASIHWQGQSLTLTPSEFHVLACLVSQPGRIFTREQLLAATGGPALDGYERNVDSHIKTLRAKLRQVDATREPIRTHRGFGYAYDPAI